MSVGCGSLIFRKVVKMTIFICDEVIENRKLATEQPEIFRFAHTALIWCENNLCENRLEVIAKDADFISWLCDFCNVDDASDDFPLWLEYEEGW
jgi:hypothetical protein